MDYQIVLLGELIYLIAGETGLSMLHGWSEGVFYSFYRDYTPMWLCACLMVLLLLVIISLLLLFLTLHFNIVALINFHVFCLCASWCIAISLTAVGLAYGTPILRMEDNRSSSTLPIQQSMNVNRKFSSIEMLNYPEGNSVFSDGNQSNQQDTTTIKIKNPFLNHYQVLTITPIILKSKPYALTFALIQFIIVMAQLLNISLIVFFNIQVFLHFESMVALLVVWASFVIWFIFSLGLVIGIIKLNDYMIVAYIIFCIAFILAVSTLLVILFFEGSRSSSVLYLIIIIAILGFTLSYAIKYLKETMYISETF